MADNIGVADNILIFTAVLVMSLSILKRQMCLKSYLKYIYEIIFVKSSRKSLRRGSQVNVICHSEFAGQITYPAQPTVINQDYPIANGLESVIKVALQQGNYSAKK